MATLLGSGNPLGDAHWPESPHVTSWVFQGCLAAPPYASSVMEPTGSFGNRRVSVPQLTAIASWRGFLIGEGGPRRHRKG